MYVKICVWLLVIIILWWLLLNKVLKVKVDFILEWKISNGVIVFWISWLFILLIENVIKVISFLVFINKVLRFCGVKFVCMKKFVVCLCWVKGKYLRKLLGLVIEWEFFISDCYIIIL